MDRFFKRVWAWIAAVVTTVVIGVILQTQNVLARLGEIGADVALSERLAMTLYDLRYLGSLYVIFVALAFLCAFFAAGLVFKFTKLTRFGLYIAAGAIAILVMLFSMKQVFFDIHMIAGARDGFGIGLQMLAGAIGGFVFFKLSSDKEKGVSK